jgi:hypothetical protein
VPSNVISGSLRLPGARSTAYDPYLLGGGSAVPYVSAWSGEELLPGRVVRHPGGGITYADETSVDRDEHGVLWTRMASRIGAGRPLFTKLHPLRQRRAMRRLLCQVCARPADRTEDGLLWLVSREAISDLADLEGVITPQPPLCLHCANVSVTSCPRLRRGYVAVRAHTRLCGVYGVRYQAGWSQLTLASDDDRVFDYREPLVRWVQAVQLARSLHNCIPVDLGEVKFVVDG